MSGDGDSQSIREDPPEIDFVIAIPSYKRSKMLVELTMKTLLGGGVPPSIIYVFIVPEDREKYETTLAEVLSMGVKLIWDGVKGLSEQKNYIQQEYFEEGQQILFVEDDISSFDISHSENLKDLNLFGFASFAFSHMRSLDKCHIWSIAPCNSAFLYGANKYEVYKGLNLMIGSFYGIINRRDMVNNPQYISKPDVWLSCKYFERDGILCKFGKVGFKSKMYSDKGGDDGLGGGVGGGKARMALAEQDARRLCVEFPYYGKYKLRRDGKTPEFELYRNPHLHMPKTPSKKGANKVILPEPVDLNVSSATDAEEVSLDFSPEVKPVVLKKKKLKLRVVESFPEPEFIDPSAPRVFKKLADFKFVNRKVRPANDVFYTSSSMVKVHMDMVRDDSLVRKGDTILEPFYGGGAYYSAYPHYFPDCNYRWSELALGRNFFDLEFEVDVIITNPPYSCITQCLMKCVDLNARVISFLIGGNNIVAKRLEYMRGCGYSIRQYLVNRCEGWSLLGGSVFITWVRDGGDNNVVRWDGGKHSVKKGKETNPALWRHMPPEDIFLDSDIRKTLFHDEEEAKVKEQPTADDEVLVSQMASLKIAKETTAVTFEVEIPDITSQLTIHYTPIPTILNPMSPLECQITRYPKVPDSLFANIFYLFESRKPRSDRKLMYHATDNRAKGWDAHESECYGMVYPKYVAGKKELVLSAPSQQYPEVYEELLKIGNFIKPDGFEFNAIHVNRNVTCPRHKDSRNQGFSLLVSFGEYSDSKICVKFSDKEHARLNTRHRPVYFNGEMLEHWNEGEIKGTKYSLVFYTKL